MTGIGSIPGAAIIILEKMHSEIPLMAASRDFMTHTSSPFFANKGIPRAISRCLIIGRFTMLPAATAQNGTNLCDEDNLLNPSSTSLDRDYSSDI